MNIEQESIKRIYEHLGDDEARYVFQNRLMYSLTGDFSFLRRVIGTTPEGKKMTTLLASPMKKLIFGAGWWGQNIVKTYSDVRFECFVDNKKNNSDCAGLPVISFDSYLKNYKNDVIIISSRLYYKEIHAQLVENGIDEEKIVNFGELEDSLMSRAYFDLPALNTACKTEEIFVDAGVFDGMTSLAFKDWAGTRFKSVYAFEPDAILVTHVLLN